MQRVYIPEAAWKHLKWRSDAFDFQLLFNPFFASYIVRTCYAAPAFWKEALDRLLLLQQENEVAREELEQQVDININKIK